MGKTGLLVLILTVCVALLGITITNLVFTLIDHFKPEPQSEILKSNRPRATGDISKKPEFADAAKRLLAGLDFTQDPCDDFYAFTCNKYLESAKIPAGASRIGTYDDGQDIVDRKIVQILDSIDPKSESETVKLVKRVYDSCVKNAEKSEGDKSKELEQELKAKIGGFPMFTKKWNSNTDLLKVAAEWLQNDNLQTFISHEVTADFRNVEKIALFLGGPKLNQPLDFYLKSTFQSKLLKYKEGLIDLLKKFAKSIGYKGEVDYEKEVSEMITLEIKLAMNVVPDDLLTNQKFGYNPFNVSEFRESFDKLGSFVDGLKFESNDYNLIVTQPRYYEALNTLIKLNTVNESTWYNYLGLKYLMHFKDFINGEVGEQVDLILAVTRHPKEAVSTDDKIECMDTIRDLMPYGPGFIYVRSIGAENRKKIVDDIRLQAELVIDSFLENVATIKFMEDSVKEITEKANEIRKNLNLGYPAFFEGAMNETNADNAELDEYHKQYIDDFDKIEKDKSYFEILRALSKAYQKTERLGRVGKTADRSDFQASPATVNAWYAPEYNSITIPFATLNPPYYNYGYPQAYNYGGQGGTLGHELTHAFDSMGVQYDPSGTLSRNCTLEYCTWLRPKSVDGFLDMAQCVISQYSEQCCPLETGNVHCANGELTQGENIADIGGQLASFNAYRTWISKYNNGAEEEGLPGLDDFTSNQIFWISYGFSWCMKQKEESLVNQMLTNEHAPGKCRVNQVMQDIPQFAKDFGCKRGQTLFPPAEKRCKVWTGV
uniref:Neprilysin n=1 Tax=Bursaphelenchus xylophilus TaxID=6326 RepID=A0A1I7RRP4_BURXY